MNDVRDVLDLIDARIQWFTELGEDTGWGAYTAAGRIVDELKRLRTEIRVRLQAP